MLLQLQNKSIRKKESRELINGIQMRPKGIEVTFDLTEYEKVNKLIRDFSLPFDSYCFSRNNLPAGINEEKIAEVLNSYWNTNNFDENGKPINGTVISTGFTEFQKNFLVLIALFKFKPNYALLKSR